MSKQPKFKKGDKVRFKLSQDEPTRLSEEVFTVISSSKYEFLKSTIFVYMVESDGGDEIFSGITESILVAADDDVGNILLDFVSKENAQNSDYLLDTYNDYMALYEFFRDYVFIKKAHKARIEWLRLVSDEQADKEE